jgi:hypothetical protein
MFIGFVKLQYTIFDSRYSILDARKNEYQVSSIEQQELSCPVSVKFKSLTFEVLNPA